MITLIMRLLLLFFGFFLCGVATTFNSTTFIFAVMFVCAWASVRPVYMIFWWLIMYGLFFGIMHYDVFAGYFLGIVGSVIIFDLTKKYIARSGYNSGFAFYFLSMIIAVIIFIITEVLYGGYFTFDLSHSLLIILFSMIVFFMSRWVIVRVENFAGLYTRGTDFKIHT